MLILTLISSISIPFSYGCGVPAIPVKPKGLLGLLIGLRGIS